MLCTYHRVLMLYTHRQRVLVPYVHRLRVVIGLCLLVVRTYRLWVLVLLGLRRPKRHVSLVLRICLARSQLLALMILQLQPGLRPLLLVAYLELLLLLTSHLRGPDPSQPTLASMLLCVRMSRYIRQLRL